MSARSPAGGRAGYGACEDEDGGLVGGSSLEPETFLEIINAANQE